MPQNWHDWDTSSTPTVIQTRSGRKLLAVAPKDGHLYGFDLGTNTLLYRVPVTRKENIDASFAVGKPANSCPGTAGGSEWNGPAYDPRSNLILIGEVEGCSAADPSRSGAGWIYAVDADSGVWKWRLKSHYPIFTGMTPTGGGLVFFGDASGSFYALDASNGARLWGQKVGGAIGGGVITYTTDGQQKVAVTAGFTSNLRPTAVVTGKIVILGL
jgi:alcohol dehydrogenase (cytochrome c)